MAAPARGRTRRWLSALAVPPRARESAAPGTRSTSVTRGVDWMRDGGRRRRRRGSRAAGAAWAGGGADEGGGDDEYTGRAADPTASRKQEAAGSKHAGAAGFLSQSDPAKYGSHVPVTLDAWTDEFGPPV